MRDKFDMAIIGFHMLMRGRPFDRTARKDIIPLIFRNFHSVGRAAVKNLMGFGIKVG